MVNVGFGDERQAYGGLAWSRAAAVVGDGGRNMCALISQSLPGCYREQLRVNHMDVSLKS